MTSSESPARGLVSVVVPVFNNGDTIVELLERIARCLETLGSPFEVVFVDDGSTDASRTVLSSMSAIDRRVRAIILERNRGQNQAVRAGLEAASGDWFAVLDADLQDPPEAIPLMLKHAEANQLPVVFATRVGNYQSPARMMTSRLYKGALRLLTNLPRNAGLFVVFDRAVRDAVLRSKGPSIVAAIGMAGFQHGQVLVQRRTRTGSPSGYRLAMRLFLGTRTLLWVIGQHARRNVIGPRAVVMPPNRNRA